MTFCGSSCSSKVFYRLIWSGRLGFIISLIVSVFIPFTLFAKNSDELVILYTGDTGGYVNPCG